MIRLRAARFADATAIARLHAESWRAAYRGMLGDAYLDGDLQGERTTFWQRALSQPPANQHVIVAEDDGDVLGFVSLYGDDDPAWGTRIEAIHVWPGQTRRGVGVRLMVAAAAWCEVAHPGKGIFLHVLQPNLDAQRFYERIGGRIAESSTWKALDGGQVPQYRIAWADPLALRAGALSATAQPT